MKKKLLLFLVMVLALGCVLLTACGETPADTTTVAPTSPFTAVTFDSVTATYDGTAKTVAVANLPEGATVSYKVNGEAVDAVSVVNAGNYTVVATLTKDGVTEEKTATIVIEKAQVTLDPTITYFAPSTEIAYDGQYHMPEALVELPEGLSVSVDGTPIANVGDMAVYTISFLFSDAEVAQNYNPPAPITDIQLTIVKGTIDMSGFLFESAELPYDGAFHKLSYDASTLPDMLDAIVTGGGVNRGEHTCTITFSFKNSADAAKYVLPEPMTATLTIGAGAITLPNAFGDRTVTYNGTNQVPAGYGNITGIATATSTVVNAAGETVTEAVLPGVYTVTVTFTVTDENAYITPDPQTYTLTINKAIRGDAEAPTWGPKGDWDFKVGDVGYFFIGGDDMVEITLPGDLVGENVTIEYKHYLNGEEVDAANVAGVYTTYVTITLTSDLYMLPENYTVAPFTWIVADKNVNVEDIVFNVAGKVYDGELYVVSANIANAAGVLNYSVVVLDAEGNVVGIADLTEAGTYTAVFTFVTDTEAGYAPLIVEKEFTIAPATVDISSVTLAWDHPLTDGAAYFVYDAAKKTVALTEDTVAALAELGVTVVGYEDNSAINVGDYTAKVTLAVDANHALEQSVFEFAWGIANSDDDSWSDIVK